MAVHLTAGTEGVLEGGAFCILALESRLCSSGYTRQDMGNMEEDGRQAAELAAWSVKAFTPAFRSCLLLGDIEHCLAGSVFAKMMAEVRVAIVADPDEAYSCTLKWAPWSQYQVPEGIRRRVKSVRIVNDTTFSCLKSNVHFCSKLALGYDLSVAPSPLAFHGPCVVKSEKNAQHDGRIVQCPQESLLPDAVYERLVDNVVDGQHVEDIRVPVVGDQIPFVYLKYRSVDSRFSNENSCAKLAGKYQVLSREEIDRLKRFASIIGLDYGEIDVLRDRSTGRIYVIDANNTPYGPPNHLAVMEADIAVRLLADAFVDEFFER